MWFQSTVCEVNLLYMILTVVMSLKKIYVILPKKNS